MPSRDSGNAAGKVFAAAPTRTTFTCNARLSQRSAKDCPRDGSRRRIRPRPATAEARERQHLPSLAHHFLRSLGISLVAVRPRSTTTRDPRAVHNFRLLSRGRTGKTQVKCHSDAASKLWPTQRQMPLGQTLWRRSRPLLGQIKDTIEDPMEKNVPRGNGHSWKRQDRTRIYSHW